MLYMFLPAAQSNASTPTIKLLLNTIWIGCCFFWLTEILKPHTAVAQDVYCNSCQYTICLFDTNNNNWEGAVASVMVDGVTVLHNITQTPSNSIFYINHSGSLLQGACYNFTAGYNSEMLLTYMPGSNPHENYYHLYIGEAHTNLSNGTLVYASLPGEQPPAINTRTASECQFTRKQYRISLFANDNSATYPGWNGGYVNVNVGGNTVLANITPQATFPYPYVTHFEFEITHYFTMSIPDDISVEYHGGEYVPTAYYGVYTADGTLLYESPTTGVPPVQQTVYHACTSGFPDVSHLYDNCTYFVCLHDTQDNTWQGGSLGVNINEIAVYQGLSLSSVNADQPCGSACFGFTLNPTENITIHYTNGIDAQQNWYSVFEGSAADLQSAQPLYNSPIGVAPPLVQSINNICGSTPISNESCTYAICLSSTDNNGWNTAFTDVWVNNAPVLSGITLPYQEHSVCFDFSFNPSDVITVNYFAGINPQNHTYQIYGGSMGNGSLIFATPASQSPPDSQNIQNYCGQTTMPNIGQGTCSYQICLNNFPGWKNSRIDLLVNNTIALFGITCESSASSFGCCFDFSVNPNDVVTVNYFSGAFSCLDAYSIWENGNGNPVYTSPYNQPPPNSQNFSLSCSIEEEEEEQNPNACLYYICLTDAAGDGWNGGYVNVWVNDDVALNNLTVPNNASFACFSFVVNPADLVHIEYIAGADGAENGYFIAPGLDAAPVFTTTPDEKPPYWQTLANLCEQEEEEEEADFCSYSICLYDEDNAGWGGAWVNVLSNDSYLLQELTLLPEQSVTCYNFEVQEGADILVTYFPDVSTSQYHYYIVFDGTDGLGSEMYNSLTTNGNVPLHTVELPNPCADGEEPNCSAYISTSSNTTELTCLLTSINLTANGGTDYLWDDNTTNSVRAINAPGNYYVTVTDSNGCTADAGITISSNNTPPNASITPTPNTTELTCTLTEIELTAEWGGVMYEWSNGVTDAYIIASTPDTYSVTITGSNGCTASASMEITNTCTDSQNCPTTSSLHVDQNVSASGDGATWATAFKTLDEALSIAHCCANVSAIYVAAGTYKPTKKPYNNCAQITNFNPRHVTFHIPDGLTLKGGYPAGGGVQNVADNPTILSGDIGMVGVSADNAYHVVLAVAPNSGGIGVTIDGFFITGGNANGIYGYTTVNGIDIYPGHGGGIFIYRGANTLTNNTVYNNAAYSGGGILCYYTNSTLTNNTVYNNSISTGGGGGGGILLYSGTNTLTNNTVYNNSATDSDGGGIFLYSGSNNTLTNNTVYNNSAINSNGGGFAIIFGSHTLANNTVYGNSTTNGNGGGIYTEDNTAALSIITLTNNTVYGNSVTNGSGGGIYTFLGTNTLTNNLFWENTKDAANNVAGADYFANGTNGNTFINNFLQLEESHYPVSNSGDFAIGTGASDNIFAQNPMFVNAANPAGADNIHRTADDGFYLTLGSPAINAGSNAALTGITTDITGANRIQKIIVDAGAYEGELCPPYTTLFVDQSVSLSGNGQTWSTAFKSLTEALDLAWQCPNVDTILVAIGVYKPTRKPYEMQPDKTGVEIITPDARDVTFHIRTGLTVLGGFPNGGGPRITDNLLTTLTGDTEELVAYHVVYIDASPLWTPANATTTLDGFIITGAEAQNPTVYPLNGFDLHQNYGGGVYINGGIVHLSNNRIDNHHANRGGGIYINQSNTTLANTQITDNFAVRGGGIFTNAATNLIHQNLFARNEAGNLGGAIYSQLSNNTIQTNQLNANTALNAGGAYYATDGNTNAQNNTFDFNEATTSGGGALYMVSGSHDFVSNTFINNTAQLGAAAYLDQDEQKLINNTFINNTADINGGGIYLANGSHTLVNNTLIGNRALFITGGGGLYTNDGTHFIDNNIFWNNKIGNNDNTPGADLFNNLANNTLRHNLLQLISSEYDPANLGINATGNLFAQNPMFIDASNPAGPDALHRTNDDGLQLQTGSPAINAGNNTLLPTGITTDIAATNRIQQATVDIGAYESAPPPCILICFNGGNAVYDAQDNCVCECPPGFYGANCETDNPCYNHPCQNGGAVSVGSEGSCGCNCPPGFTGANCETPIPCYNHPCQNGGAVSVGSDGSCGCNCPPGFTGENCETPIPCYNHPCQNGGAVSVGSDGSCGCNCPPGFTGENCETPIPCYNHPCQNGGAVSVGSNGSCGCNCPPGFTGANCETPIPCYNHPCQNGGAVSVGSDGSCGCNCPPGFTGENCETPIPCYNHPCQNGGAVSVGSNGSCGCNCPPGFTGANCETPIPCYNHPCQNGGAVSVGSDGSCGCNCPPGFTGENCETPIPCYNHPCQNGGAVSVSSDGSCGCNCPPGFTGADCSETYPCPVVTTTTVTACGSYVWAVTGLTYTQSGVYMVEVNDCTTEVLNLTIPPGLVVSLNGTTNVCVGGTIGLVATGGNTYQWSGPNGFTGTGGSITRSNATLSMSGTYTVTITNNGCSTILSINVTVHPIPSATITSATSVCSGGTISLSAPAGAVSYAWSGPGGFTASGATIMRSNATTAMTGTYTVTVTGIGGCTATASKSVSVSSPTLASITGATSFCSNGTVTLTATTAGVSCQWSGPGGFSFSGATMTRTPAVAGTYTVTVTNASGCISTASRTVLVTTTPNAVIANNSNCTRIWLIASGGNSYAWSGPNGYSITGTTVLRNPATATMWGTYTVTVTGSGGCSTTASIIVSPCAAKNGEELEAGLKAYPNPTGGITTLSFYAPVEEEVQLSVFAIDGREVAVLFNGTTQAENTYELQLDATLLPSGTYYAVLRRASGNTEQLPVVIVR